MYQEKERMMDFFIKQHPNNSYYPQAKILVEYVIKYFEKTNDKVLVFSLQKLIEELPNLVKDKSDLFILYAYSIIFFNIMGLIVKLTDDNYLVIINRNI